MPDSSPPYRSVAEQSKCSRCGDTVSDRTPPEGFTMQVGLQATITTTTWKLRLRLFRWTWLPKDPHDRVNETYTTLDLCDWCAGDVFLFAQGLPPRDRASASTAPDGES